MTTFAVSPLQLGALALTGVAFMLLVLVKRLRTRRATAGVERDPRSLIGLLVQAAGVFLTTLGAVDATRPIGNPLAIAGTIATLVLGGSAVMLFARSAAALGANWSLVARTSDAHELIRHGPFSRLRHPIYTAMLLFNAAIGVGLGHDAMLLVALPLHLTGTWIRIRSEERLLRARFGPAYEEYARHTPALLPRGVRPLR